MTKENTAITACGHVYHFSCVMESVRATRNCPTCRYPLSSTQITPCATMMQCTQDEDSENRIFGSKIVAIRNVLRKIHAESDDRAILFLQFANIVDSMQRALEKVGLKTFVLSGTVQVRTRVLQDF